MPCKIQSLAVSKYDMSENDFIMCSDPGLFMAVGQQLNEVPLCLILYSLPLICCFISQRQAAKMKNGLSM